MCYDFYSCKYCPSPSERFTPSWNCFFDSTVMPYLFQGYILANPTPPQVVTMQVLLKLSICFCD